MDREGVEDRVYRLHYNSSQRRADTCAAVSALRAWLQLYAMHVLLYCSSTY